MSKKETKLEKKYNTYSKLPEEELMTKASDTDKKIEEIKELLPKIKGEEKRKELETELTVLEKEKRTMDGFSKNKGKIEKIKSYQGRIQEKVEKLKEEKAILEKSIKEYEKNAKEIKGRYEKDSASITNEEYENYIANNSNLEEMKKRVLEVKEEIQRKLVAISKCDLVWKSLFQDKSWNEIYVRAESRNFTSSTRTYSKIKETAHAVEKTVLNSEKGKTSEKSKVEPLPPVIVSEFEQKHPRIAGALKFLRHPIVTINSWFKVGEEKEMPAEEKAEPTKTEEKIEPKQEKNQRDAFIEGLRRMVEKEEYVPQSKQHNKSKEKEER